MSDNSAAFNRVTLTLTKERAGYAAQVVKAGRGWLITRNSATLADTDYEHVAHQIAHALNAYPLLVERTERAAMTVFNPAQFPDCSAETLAAIKRGWDAAMNAVWERNSALLRDLGEN